MPFVKDPVNYCLFSITISVIFLSVRGVHPKGDEELQVLRCPQLLQSWIRSHSVPPEDQGWVKYFILILGQVQVLLICSSTSTSTQKYLTQSSKFKYFSIKY